jgi:hypothetical protein
MTRGAVRLLACRLTLWRCAWEIWRLGGITTKMVNDPEELIIRASARTNSSDVRQRRGVWPTRWRLCIEPKPVQRAVHESVAFDDAAVWLLQETSKVYAQQCREGSSAAATVGTAYTTAESALCVIVGAVRAQQVPQQVLQSWWLPVPGSKMLPPSTGGTGLEAPVVSNHTPRLSHATHCQWQATAETVIAAPVSDHN